LNGAAGGRGPSLPGASPGRLPGENRPWTRPCPADSTCDTPAIAKRVKVLRALLQFTSRIDVSVLPDLADQDLEKLGVLLSDRRKMLRAIAALRPVSGNRGSRPPGPTIPLRSLGPPTSALRQHVPSFGHYVFDRLYKPVEVGVTHHQR
jgi:hypothetical protein